LAILSGDAAEHDVFKLCVKRACFVNLGVDVGDEDTAVVPDLVAGIATERLQASQSDRNDFVVSSANKGGLVSVSAKTRLKGETWPMMAVLTE